MRELTTIKVGFLSREVVRTHRVHPELMNGTFQFLDYQTMVGGVEQQFE